VTRNAVIGKVHRMGLSGRVTRTRVSTPRTRKTREPSHPGRPAPAEASNNAYRTAATMRLKPVASVKPEPIPDPVPIRVADIPVGERVTILMLSDKTCRWPIGDPSSEDFCFCGKTPKDGVPYCAGHAAIAYQQQNDRRRRSG
jgi:GcrA cell cycle regulator